MTTKAKTKDLSAADERLLKGYDDILQPEPEQLPVSFPEKKTEEDPIENVNRIVQLRNRAREIVNKMNEMIGQVDQRCAHLSVPTNQERGSDLAQAMWRLFQVSTTTVTYDYYKKALALRAQLAEEDRQRLRTL